MAPETLWCIGTDFDTDSCQNQRWVILLDCRGSNAFATRLILSKCVVHFACKLILN